MIGDDFRIRCSSIHRIMANMKPEGLTAAEKADLKLHEGYEEGTVLTEKGNVMVFTENRKERLAELRHLKANPRQPELPAGAKTLCDEWLQDAMFCRHTGFGSKQTEKGTRTEDDGIDLLREYLEDPFLPDKNKWRVVGEFIEGECDLLYSPWVRDIKSCYTHATMDLYAEEPVREHYCQLQGYGHLFSASKLGLDKVLCNMPEDMILKEAYYATKSKFGPDYTEKQLEDVTERLTRRYTYDDLPIEMRVNSVAFDFDPGFIDEVVKRVKMCREYINAKFMELPEHKREAVTEYVAMRKRKAHYADVQRTNERAKEWRLTRQEKEPTQLTALNGEQKQVA